MGQYQRDPVGHAERDGLSDAEWNRITLGYGIRDSEQDSLAKRDGVGNTEYDTVSFGITFRYAQRYAVCGSDVRYTFLEEDFMR